MEKSNNYKGNYDILIDDSGWGSPLGGVVMGVYKFDTRQFSWRIIEENHFQVPKYEKKSYLSQIALKVLEMINELNVDKNAKILVCRGYCNNHIPQLLKYNGYMYVERGVVGEPLQTTLEEKFKEYLADLGFNGYKDPKVTNKKEISRSFYATVKWAMENDKLNLCKTGWSYFTENKHLRLEVNVKKENTETTKKIKRKRIKVPIVIPSLNF